MAPVWTRHERDKEKHFNIQRNGVSEGFTLMFLIVFQKECQSIFSVYFDQFMKTLVKVCGRELTRWPLNRSSKKKHYSFFKGPLPNTKNFVTDSAPRVSCHGDIYFATDRNIRLIGRE